eukprot:m.107747 g.107747  ORF g.107747 m.107747 type:complete len:843 (-) comp8988_c0_seq5:214-2742(-)
MALQAAADSSASSRCSSARDLLHGAGLPRAAMNLSSRDIGALAAGMTDDSLDWILGEEDSSAGHHHLALSDPRGSRSHLPHEQAPPPMFAPPPVHAHAHVSDARTWSSMGDESISVANHTNPGAVHQPVWPHPSHHVAAANMREDVRASHRARSVSEPALAPYAPHVSFHPPVGVVSQPDAALQAVQAVQAVQAALRPDKPLIRQSRLARAGLALGALPIPVQTPGSLPAASQHDPRAGYYHGQDVSPSPSLTPHHMSVPWLAQTGYHHDALVSDKVSENPPCTPITPITPAPHPWDACVPQAAIRAAQVQPHRVPSFYPADHNLLALTSVAAAMKQHHPASRAGSPPVHYYQLGQSSHAANPSSAPAILTPEQARMLLQAPWCTPPMSTAPASGAHPGSSARPMMSTASAPLRNTTQVSPPAQIPHAMSPSPHAPMRESPSFGPSSHYHSTAPAAPAASAALVAAASRSRATSTATTAAAGPLPGAAGASLQTGSAPAGMPSAAAGIMPSAAAGRPSAAANVFFNPDTLRALVAACPGGMAPAMDQHAILAAIRASGAIPPGYLPTSYMQAAQTLPPGSSVTEATPAFITATRASPVAPDSSRSMALQTPITAPAPASSTGTRLSKGGRAQTPSSRGRRPRTAASEGTASEAPHTPRTESSGIPARFIPGPASEPGYVGGDGSVDEASLLLDTASEPAGLAASVSLSAPGGPLRAVKFEPGDDIDGLRGRRKKISDMSDGEALRCRTANRMAGRRSRAVDRERREGDERRLYVLDRERTLLLQTVRRQRQHVRCLVEQIAAEPALIASLRARGVLSAAQAADPASSSANHGADDSATGMMT